MYDQRVNGDDDQTFGIREAAQRTGLNSSTIRMWESRYEAVIPLRTDTNRRRYRAEDIDRLRLLQILTQRGNAIGSIAKLGLEDLRQRLIGDEMSEPVFGETNKVIIVGAGVSEKITLDRLPELNIVARFTHCAEANAKANLSADLVVVELETLFPENVAQIRDLIMRTKAERGILLYHFASAKTATALARAIPGLMLLQAPVSGDRIRRECLVQLSAMNEGAASVPIDAGPIAPRLYNQEQLAKLAEISTTVECECPQHLAGLLQSLTAFENYSRECEDRNPQDALLHAFLHRTTAKARRSMEEALQHLVRVEGITVG